jgi:hypothetical protein
MGLLRSAGGALRQTRYYRQQPPGGGDGEPARRRGRHRPAEVGRGHGDEALDAGLQPHDAGPPQPGLGADLNLIISDAAIDPIGGSVPHRSYLCQIRPVAGAPNGSR